MRINCLLFIKFKNQDPITLTGVRKVKSIILYNLKLFNLCILFCCFSFLFFLYIIYLVKVNKNLSNILLFRLLFLLFLKQKKCSRILSIDQNADELSWAYCVEIFNEMECKGNENSSATSAAALPPKNHDLFLEQGKQISWIFFQGGFFTLIWNFELVNNVFEKRNQKNVIKLDKNENRFLKMMWHITSPHLTSPAISVLVSPRSTNHRTDRYTSNFGATANASDQ